MQQGLGLQNLIVETWAVALYINLQSVRGTLDEGRLGGRGDEGLGDVDK